MVRALKEEVGLPLHVHCHYIGGMAPMNYLKAIEAGADIVDTAVVALAFGNSQPAVEMIVAALKESPYDTGIDLDLLFEIAEYWEAVRERKKLKRGITTMLQMEVFSHQVPGGMMSNLMSQMELQKASDRMPDVFAEVPRVRAEVGYPPLVTPLSQIVGTQAVLNVLTGKRWSVVPNEMKDYIRGYYGKAPGPMAPEIVARVLGDEKPLSPDVRPGSMATGTYAEAEAEIGDLARSEEDVLMYALFPNEARQYLSKHKEGAEKAVFMLSEEIDTVREDESVDVNQIRELIKIVESSDISEIVIEENGATISVRRGGYSAAPAAAPAATTPGASTVAGAHAPAASDESARPASHKAITAQMVGTFYRSPSPGSDPFVAVGDVIEEAHPVCLLEAMKLMNEIEMPERGTIREIVAEDAMPVDYGAVLFYYEPTG
jgi:oxaloacetate decarboxylase alpha subunit